LSNNSVGSKAPSDGGDIRGGGCSVSEGYTTVQVLPTNDAPVIDVYGRGTNNAEPSAWTPDPKPGVNEAVQQPQPQQQQPPLWYVRGGVPTVLLPSLRISDPDSTQLQRARVAVSFGFDTGDMLDW
jgi:hypothetical protein